MEPVAFVLYTYLASIRSDPLGAPESLFDHETLETTINLWRPSSPVSPQPVPFLLYNKDNDIQFADGSRLFDVPRRALLIVNGDLSEVHFDFPAAEATKAILASSAWTTHLHKDGAKMVWDALSRRWGDLLSSFEEPYDGIYPRRAGLSGVVDHQLPSVSIAQNIDNVLRDL